MCTVIEAECVLANALSAQKKTTLSDLNGFRSKIRQVFTNDYVYLDVCAQSVIVAVNNRPDLFHWDGDAIERSTEITQEYLRENINWQVPEKVRDAFEKVF